MVIASVGSAVSPVGTAAAASETYQFSGSPEIVAVNVTGASGDVTVEFSTEGGPASGSQIIAKTTVNATSTSSPEVALANLGAYDSVNATVTGTSVSNLSTAKYGGRLVMPSDQITMLGGTGGDTDLNCGLQERVAKAVDSEFTQLDCVAQPGSTSINTTGLDAQQVKQDTYAAAANQHQGYESFNSTMTNYLEDAQTTALIKGKNAYIQALNNGSAKSVATSEAKAAIEDYYAVKQIQLAKQWSASAENVVYLSDTTKQEGVSEDFVEIPVEDPDGSVTYYQDVSGDPSDADIYLHDTQAATVSLVNGSSVDSTALVANLSDGIDTNHVTISPLDGPVHDVSYDSSTTNNEHIVDLHRVNVDDPSGGSTDVMDFSAYQQVNQDIIAQSDNAKAQMDTLANNTYDAYTQGEINNTDLVDPYTLSAEYSPGSEFQGWAAAQLTLLGQNNPDAMENIGYMNVTDETTNTSYQGVLMSPSNPSFGEFTVNNTYDAATLSGQQYIVTDSQVVELTGNFTLTAAQTHSGESVQNVTMYEKQYTTTNVTELQQLYDDLSKTRAEIEAREQNLLSSGGGGLLGSSSTLALVVIAGGAVYLLGREERGDT